MSDGRSIVANGKSESLGHNALLQKQGMTNNAQYRDYMIKNAKQIMMSEYRNASNDTGFSEEGRFADYLLASVAPVAQAKDSKQMPVKVKGNQENLGVQVSYKQSDLKNIYLTREQLFERRDYPSYTPLHF